MAAGESVMGALLPILALAGALYIATSSGSASTKPAEQPLRNWTGRIGPFALRVTRNGAGWAWYVESVGSGSEATATLALQQAVRAAFAAPTLAPDADFTLASDDQVIVATVDNTPPVGASVGGAWGWGIANINAGVADEHEGFSTRGRATLEMLTALRPYTNGEQ